MIVTRRGAGSWSLTGRTAGLLLLGALCGAPAAVAQGGGPRKRLFYQDFRGRPLDENEVRLEGPDAQDQVKVEPEGLRIRLPGKTPKPSATGVSAVPRFDGDCCITMTYELLRAEAQQGTVAGVQLYAMALTPTSESVMLARFNWPNGKKVYICQRSRTGPDGKRQHFPVTFPATTDAGQLRLVRRGDQVLLLAAEQPGGEFRELRKFDFSAEDLTFVRVAADNGSSDNVLDVRIQDFEVREEPAAAAGAAVPAAPALPAAAPAREAPVPWKNELTQAGGQAAARPRGFLVAAVIICSILGAGGLVLWLYARRSRGRKTPPPPVKNDAQPSHPRISVTCPHCGKALRVSATLAGKRVRCPQCRETILTPRADAEVPS
jgi:predicted Zn finger-like uncharacterized protein